LEAGYVPVEGGRLYYETNGHGHPVVLIHAGFLDRRMWDRQFDRFAASYRVIRYDVRGFGRSDRPSEKYSDIADLRALLEALRTDTTHLIGVSMGGRIAIDFTAAHAQSVDRLILVAPGVSGYQVAGPDEQRVWDDFEKRMKPQEEAVRENRIADAVEMDVDTWAAAATPASRHRIKAIAMDNAHTQVRHPAELNVMPDPPGFRRLQEIRSPTLIIVGDRDVPGMQLMAERIHDMISGSTKVVIPGADHIVNMSRPEEFDRAALGFLGGMG